MNAQQNGSECATLEPITPDPTGVYSYSTNSEALENCEPIVLNVKFWGVNYPNGLNDFPTRRRDVLQGIANLNILYN